MQYNKKMKEVKSIVMDLMIGSLIRQLKQAVIDLMIGSLIRQLKQTVIDTVIQSCSIHSSYFS